MGDSGGSVLEGQVTHVLFKDAASLFAAVKVAPEGGGPEVSVIGEFLDVSAGDEFMFTGDWETHPKWGPQLRVRTAQRKLPRQPEAVVAYLGGGLFPGVGPGLARRVVRHRPADSRADPRQPGAGRGGAWHRPEEEGEADRGARATPRHPGAGALPPGPRRDPGPHEEDP